MRALVQRVHSARVEVDQRIVSEIGPGLLVLVGFSHADTQAVAVSMSHRFLNFPVFDCEDAGSALEKSVMQKNYELLLVSQFSLYGVFKGNRLDFHDAMASHQAKPLYEALLESLCQLYDTDRIKDGIFGVKREVFLVNNGPMAFQLDSDTFGNGDS